MKQLWILLMFNCFILKGQNYYDNLQKYWNYRYHLVGDNLIKDQHMPWESGYPYKLGEPGIVSLGSGPGKSLPATSIQLSELQDNGATLFDEAGATSWLYISINHNPTQFDNDRPCYNQIENHFSELLGLQGVVIWDDQSPSALAKYISVLATEWKLLKRGNLSTVQTENELKLALDALERMDAFSATKYPGETSAPDGFFYRDDVPYDLAFGSNFGPNDIVSANGACTYANHDCVPGGTYISDKGGNMSKDNLIYILNSLAFVVEMLDNSSSTAIQLKVQAQVNAMRMLYWIRDAHHGPLGVSYGDWVLVDPYNAKVCKGFNALAWSYMLAKAVRRITQHANPAAYQNALSGGIGKLIWQLYLTYLGAIVPNFGLTGQTWSTVQGTLLASTGNLFNSNYLPGIVADRVYAETNTIDDGPNIHLDLINAVLNNKVPYLPKSIYDNILNQFPCFSYPRDKSDNGNWTEASNELDYMLLFNLYALKWSTPYTELSDFSGVWYSNLMDRTITAHFPTTLYSIGGTPSVTYGNNVNPVTIQAANSLTLVAHCNPGSRVYFNAPHAVLIPGFLADYGSVVTVENARMTCGNNAYLNTAGNTVYAAKFDEDEDENDLNLQANEFSEDTLKEYRREIQTLLLDPDYPQEDKDEIVELLNQMPSEIYGSYSFDLTVSPNPFNDKCSAGFWLIEDARVKMELYDINGNWVSLVQNGELKRGYNTVVINREGLSAGIYVLAYHDSNNSTAQVRVSIY